MVLESWKIYWGEHSAESYLYGSKITFHKKDDVEFENNLMPPGTVIKQWFSKTNYQRNRIEPTLPMIDGESFYQIAVSIDCKENENFLLKIIFYDRYEKEAGSMIIRDKLADFRCPLKTYSYKIQLVNGGMTGLLFHSITIREVSNESEEKIKENS